MVRQIGNSVHATFYSPTPGLEVMRVLSVMALSKDLTILFSDIGVAFMNTSMPEGEPVHAEPPEGVRKQRHGVAPAKGIERLGRRITTLPRTLR